MIAGYVALTATAQEIIAPQDADFDVQFTVNGGAYLGPDSTVAVNSNSMMFPDGSGNNEGRPYTLKLRVGESLWGVKQNTGSAVSFLATPS